MYQIHFFDSSDNLMRVSRIVYSFYADAIVHVRSAVASNASLPRSRRFSYAQIVSLIVK